MTLFIQCDLLYVRCILVCDVTHEWVPDLFCAIAMYGSNVSTLQIASKPIVTCEQFHKNTCIKLLSHAEPIAPCERTFIRKLFHQMPNHVQTSQSRVRTQEPASVKNEATALWYQSVTASTNTAETDAKLVRNSIMSCQLRNEFCERHTLV